VNINTALFYHFLLNLIKYLYECDPLQYVFTTVSQQNWVTAAERNQASQKINIFSFLPSFLHSSSNVGRIF